MKKTIVLLVLCISVLFLSNCARKTSSAIATDLNMEKAARVAEIKAKYNEQQINEGGIVFRNTCAKCHKLPDPKAFSLKKLDKILPKMVRKAKLDKDKAAEVCAWVFTHMS